MQKIYWEFDDDKYVPRVDIEDWAKFGPGLYNGIDFSLGYAASGDYYLRPEVRLAQKEYYFEISPSYLAIYVGQFRFRD
ncbi:MAG TPA: hypothetical protein ENJ82_14705 [Bacteroidetes bacterium]|nr:hypothetical protein [Bacteroidota bacterium]